MNGPADDDEALGMEMSAPDTAANGNVSADADRSLAGRLFRPSAARKNGNGELRVGENRTAPRIASIEVAKAVVRSAESQPYVLTEILPENIEIPPEPPLQTVGMLSGLQPAALGIKAFPISSVAKAVPVKPLSESQSPAPEADGCDKKKPVGISAPPLRERRPSSHRRLRRGVRQAVAVTVAGVTIGGAAMAVIYLLVVGVSTAVVPG